MSLIQVILGILSSSLTRNPNCSYNQSVHPSQTYYVYSPGYPHNYTPGERCTWIATCPEGYKCRLECPDVNLPESSSCSEDRLFISTTGDPELSSAKYYCGQRTLNITSDAERLSVDLISSNQSPGGRFYCRLSAQPAAFRRDLCTCGYKRTYERVTGTQETGVNEYPMMAGIVFANTYRIICSGVIISNRHVMSTTHCVINRNTSEVAVVVGEHNVEKNDSSATQLYRVTSIQNHPLYTTSNYDNDISILTVDQDIAFSDRVGPVCLPFKFNNTDFIGSKVTVLGWGTASLTLRKVDVDVISQEDCERQEPLVTPRRMCTLTPRNESCQDETGGPVLYTDPTNRLLYSVGIVSYGSPCASNLPTVDTRVTAYLDWITEVTKENFCKV